MFTLKNYKKALIGVGVTVFCSTLLAQTPRDPISTIDPPDFNRTGQTGFQFLHLPTNARSAAMGGIMNGMRNSTVSSIFNNPANLVDVKNIDAAFTPNHSIKRPFEPILPSKVSVIDLGCSNISFSIKCLKPSLLIIDKSALIFNILLLTELFSKSKISIFLSVIIA